MKMSDEDFNKFLENVKDIEAMVKGMASDDSSLVKDSMSKADAFLENQGVTPTQRSKSSDNTGINRTVINQAAFDDIPNNAQPVGAEQASQASFMSALEKDAKERAEKRKVRIKTATSLKELGNTEFKAERYEKAINFYTQGMEHCKDMTVLYTNRALAYIKLQQYEKALDDCDWAIKVNRECVKAYINKGRAYLGMNKFNESIECYNMATQLDPKKAELIAGYKSQVEFMQRRAGQDEVSDQQLSAGDNRLSGLVSMLDRCNIPGQEAEYYNSIMLSLVDILAGNPNEKSLFRTSGGFDLTQTHSYISPCFQTPPSQLSNIEINMCCHVLYVYTEACHNDEFNQHYALELPGFSLQLLRMIELEGPAYERIRKAILAFLDAICINEQGRISTASMFDLYRLLHRLLTLVRSNDAAVAGTAVTIISHMVHIQEVKVYTRDKIDLRILPAFEKLLEPDSCDVELQSVCLAGMSILTTDDVIRLKMTMRKECWEVCLRLLDHLLSSLDREPSQHALKSLIALLYHLSQEGTLHARHFAESLTAPFCTIISSPITVHNTELRSFTLSTLGRILAISPEAVDRACHLGIVKSLIVLIKNEEPRQLINPTVKCLTICSQFNKKTPARIVEGKVLKALIRMLKDPDDGLVGNAALCLTECIQVPKVAAAMVKTNVIQDLLVQARDRENHTVQHNCAILVAKLTQADSRHLEKLRELSGHGILHDVLNRAEKK